MDLETNKKKKRTNHFLERKPEILRPSKHFMSNKQAELRKQRGER